MFYDDDKSYQRYKRYRLNKYRYEQEQIYVPLTIIVIGAVIMAIWKWILITLIIVGTLLIINWRLRKRLVTSQPVILAKEDAQEGVLVHMNVKTNIGHAKADLEIPPGVKDGQKFVVKNVLVEDETGKQRKMKLYLTIKIA